MGKKIAVLLAVLLLLAGGGGAAYAYLVTEDEPDVPTPAGVPGMFIPIDPIALPILKDGSLRGQIVFGIELELGPGRSFDALRPSMVRLRSAFVTELSHLVTLDWPGGAALDLAVAKRRLQDRADRMLGAGTVAGILFPHIQERIIR